jgi:asparaginyl-tRNA synthetase
MLSGRDASVSASPSSRAVAQVQNEFTAGGTVDCAGEETSTPRRLRVRDIIDAEATDVVGKQIVLKGWVRTLRAQKSLAFIEVNDGSSRRGLQAVYAADNIASMTDSPDCTRDSSFADTVASLNTGAAVSIRGIVKESPGKGQKYEVSALEVVLVGACSSDYPLQKKRHSLDFLRGIAHLRPRTNTIAAVARVRSALAFATHEYFQGLGFHYLQSPLITASDCEGAGEMFRVTTLPLDDVSSLPLLEDKDKPALDAETRRFSSSCSVDFSEDFFGKAAYLTVSGQLSGETYACALGDIYTFGPTFRAENSQTTRHLAEACIQCAIFSPCMPWII